VILTSKFLPIRKKRISKKIAILEIGIRKSYSFSLFVNRLREEHHERRTRLKGYYGINNVFSVIP
jgi:hypothetical protein